MKTNQSGGVEIIENLPFSQIASKGGGCCPESADDGHFVFFAAQAELWHGDADGGRYFVVPTENRYGKADAVFGTLFAVYSKSLRADVLVFVSKISRVSDGTVGKAIDFEAAQQSFSRDGGLEGRDGFAKRAGVGRQDVANDVAHTDDLRTLYDRDDLNPVLEQSSQTRGFRCFQGERLHVR
jgi:hypothetical protein